MSVSRIDLADAGSPEKIVSLILKHENGLSTPVPIESLSNQLDIQEIQDLTSDNFEGGLLTDQDRSFGIILAKRAFEARWRFTVAHELGHFLIASHIPADAGRFMCSRTDMLQANTKDNDRRKRMEAEANRFASLLLIPPPLLRPYLKSNAEPDLQDIPRLARTFKVSKEAMARAYTQYHEACIAIVITQHGRVLRSYRSFEFPFVSPTGGESIPKGSSYHRMRLERSIASDFTSCAPETWLAPHRRVQRPALYEQVYPQQEGYALILLHLEQADEDEAREERDIERSWQINFPAGGRRRR